MAGKENCMNLYVILYRTNVPSSRDKVVNKTEPSGSVFRLFDCLLFPDRGFQRIHPVQPFPRQVEVAPAKVPVGSSLSVDGFS